MAGPIAASRVEPRWRRSRPVAMSRSRKWRTPLAEVKTTQSNEASRPSAASSGPRSATGWMLEQRGQQDLGSERFEAPRRVVGRLDRAGHDDPLAEQRERLEPVELRAAGDHVADHQQGGKADSPPRPRGRARLRASRRRSAAAARFPRLDHRGGGRGRLAPGDQGLADVPESGYPHVDDQRPGKRARAGQSSRPTLFGSSWPVTNATAEAASRCVTAIPA